MPGSGSGAPGSYTDAGPPLKIRPRGARRRISAALMVPGTSSQYTRASRTRRAMSCEYWEPKSRTRTVSWATVGSAGAIGPRLGMTAIPRLTRSSGARCGSHPHPDALLTLLHLALGLDRGGDDHLGALEVLDVARAAHAHRALQRADQVHAAVVDVGGAEEDLLELALDARADARSARQVGVWRGHAPVVAAAGSLGCGREDGADHDRVGATREGLGDVATEAHAPIGDDGDALAAAALVVVARGSAVGGSGHLGNADTEHATRGAGRSRADADEKALDACVHQLERGRVVDTVAGDDGDVERRGQLLEVEVLVALADVARGEDCALHHEHVSTCLLHDGRAPLRTRRRGGDGAGAAGRLDLLDAQADEAVLHGSCVDLLEEHVDVLRRRLGDVVKDVAGILVARLHAVEVEHGETAEASHLLGEADIDDAVHGRRQERDRERRSVEGEAQINLVGIDGHPSGHQRHLVEAVGAPRHLSPTELDLHTASRSRSEDRNTQRRTVLAG